MAAVRLPTSQAPYDVDAVKRRGLREFVTRAWSQVEPGKMVSGWHIDAMCEHLQACTEKQINRLIINVPPGSMKSLTSGVFFPVWNWIVMPEMRMHYLSYDRSLAQRDAVSSRALINSDWFQERWGRSVGGVWMPHEKSRAAGYYKNNRGGIRITVTMRGGSTGWHAHGQVCDDPIKPTDTQGGSDKTRTVLKKVEDLWSGTLATRIADPDFFYRVIVMQRLHDADLCGVEISNGGYVHLMLPMKYEPKRACVTVLGFKDPRTEPNELLWPGRFDEKAVVQLEKELGQFASAQLQQDPVPATGGIFERDWFKQYWSPDGSIQGTVALPKTLDQTLTSWDCTFKGGDLNDFVVGQAIGRRAGQFFMLDQERGRWSFTQTLDAIKRLARRYPRVMTHLVETKANGDAVLDSLTKEMPGMLGVDPEGGKEARANAVSGLWRSGNVFLPHPSLPGAEWVQGFVEECCRFPKAPNDDSVDAMTQGLSFLHHHTNPLLAAMAVLMAEKS